MTATIHTLDTPLARQLRQSIALAPKARAVGPVRPTMIEMVQRGREERRRSHVREVDLGKLRNANGNCARCGEPMDARMLIEWLPKEAVASHTVCAGGGK